MAKDDYDDKKSNVFSLIRLASSNACFRLLKNNLFQIVMKQILFLNCVGLKIFINKKYLIGKSIYYRLGSGDENFIQ